MHNTCFALCLSAVKVRSARRTVDGSDVLLVAGKKSVFKKSGLVKSDLRGRKSFYVQNGDNCRCEALTSGQSLELLLQ